MKPPPFDYRGPATIREVLEALVQGEREVKVLAGGQSLIPVLNLRMSHPEVLVDVCRVPELRELSVDHSGALHVRAGVRQAAVLADPRVAAGWPLLAAALREIGHPQIRNRGTVCGSLAHADPAAELPAAAIALGARLVVASVRGQREISAEDFFLAPFTTALGEDELLLETVFPASTPGTGHGFAEFATRRGDFATAGAAAEVVRRDRRVDACRVVLFGVAGTPMRVGAAEAAVIGGSLDPESVEVLRAAVGAALDPADDVHATGEFRVELAGHLAVSALEQAWEATR